MKIGVLVSEFPKTTETFVLRNIKEFIESGHNVTVFHLKPFRHDQVTHAFAKPLLSRGFYLPFFFNVQVVIACLIALLNKPKLLTKLLCEIIQKGYRDKNSIVKSIAIIPKALAYGRHAPQYKVTHIHAEFAGLPATCAWIISRLYGIPFSFSCHAHDIFITQNLLREKIQDTTFVRTISEYNRSFLLNEIDDINPNKIKIIRCGIAPEESNSSQKKYKNKDIFSILYVGSLLERKGVDHLLLALSRLDQLNFNWQCRIIGDGSARAGLKNIAHELNIDKKVIFYGSRSLEYINKAYQIADLVAVPSIVGPEGRCEGIPVVIMEALLASCPVIATSISGIPELIEDGVTGYLIQPGDIKALAEKIIWVYNNITHASSVALQGRKRVLAEYNASSNAQILLREIIMHSSPSLEEK